MRAQIRKINEPIDRAQHVIGWHELVEAKFVKKTLLHHEPIAHHRRISLPPQIERITAKHWSRALFQRNRQHRTSREGLANVGDEVVRMLDSDRHANQGWSDSYFTTSFLAQAGMHRRRGMANQGFRSSQTDRQFEHLKAIEESERLRLPPLNFEEDG